MGTTTGASRSSTGPALRSARRTACVLLVARAVVDASHAFGGSCDAVANPAIAVLTRRYGGVRTFSLNAGIFGTVIVVVAVLIALGVVSSIAAADAATGTHASSARAAGPIGVSSLLYLVLIEPENLSAAAEPRTRGECCESGTDKERSCCEGQSGRNVALLG